MLKSKDLIPDFLHLIPSRSCGCLPITHPSPKHVKGYSDHDPSKQEHENKVRRPAPKTAFLQHPTVSIAYFQLRSAQLCCRFHHNVSFNSVNFHIKIQKKIQKDDVEHETKSERAEEQEAGYQAPYLRKRGKRSVTVMI